MNIQHLRADYLILRYLNLPDTLSILLQPIILLLIGGILGVAFLLLIRKILSSRHAFKEPMSLLKLVPPAKTEQEAYTTEQLFSLIHSLGSQKTWKDRLIGRNTRFSLEIASTQKDGIRYLVRTPEKYVNGLKRSLLSYLPHLKVEEVNEYLPQNLDDTSYSKIVEFKLARHFAYPLKKQNELEKHDPVAYITGMMTKLSPEELISFQVILSPTQAKNATFIKQKILRSDDVIAYLNGLADAKFTIFTFPVTIFSMIVGTLSWTLNTIVSDFANARISARQAQMRYAASYYIQGQPKPEKILNTFEQELVSSVQQKVDQPLFDTTIRIFVSVKKKDSLTDRISGLQSSFGVFSVPGYQSIKRKYKVPLNIFEKYRFLLLKNRLQGIITNGTSLLSVSEISDLYHFPFTRITQTENIVKVHSKELPAPLSLKNNPDLDVVFAKNTYGGQTTMIGLTAEERLRHMYVIGATGTGKSTMLMSMIAQDLKNGKGVCIVDPHGDLAETAITSIPEDRINDFIYFNPVDIKYPIGLNLLELTPGLDEDEALIEKEFVAENVISLFRKMFSDAWSAHPHRIEYILRNTIHTAFTLENPTLFTIFDLLNNPVFQKKAVQGLRDENLKNFWKYEFGKAGDYQKVKMVAPVTARIGRFLFSPSAKRILEQQRSTINFDEILDQKKILICNLSKGRMGEDTSEVMGIMILNKIQLAALKRAKKAQKDRSSFYLYVDEFQNFATPSFIQMLSESRKYGLALTMAEQSTSQQKDKNIVQIVLANTGTVVTFRSANPQDEDLLLPQFRPYVEYGEIANLPSFHFYMKKAAIHPEEPLSGITIPIVVSSDDLKKERFINSSRHLYASKYTPKQKTEKVIDQAQRDIEEVEKKPIRKSVLPA